MVRCSDLRTREVVNIGDGKRLGLIEDIEIDLETGRITALIVPGSGRFLGIFGRPEDYVIPWESIKRIGVDTILVDVQPFTEPGRDRAAR